MKTEMVYRVAATSWEHGWELHISDGKGHIGTTQSTTLGNDAQRMVRSYLDAYHFPAGKIIVTQES